MIKWAEYYYCLNGDTLESYKVKNVIEKSGEDIHTVISKNGMKLPLDYEQMVLSRNGGRVQDNALKEIPTEYRGVKITLPKNRFILMDFYGITDDRDFSLLYAFDEGYVSKKLLPIAADPGGDTFLMDVEDSPNNGQIYVEIHDEFDENDERERVKIADSFTDFLDLILWDNTELTDASAES